MDVIQGVAGMEVIMEHIATSLGADPLEFRMNNLLTEGDPCLDDGPLQGVNKIPQIVTELKEKSNFEARKRQVETFNQVSCAT